MFDFLLPHRYCQPTVRPLNPVRDSGLPHSGSWLCRDTGATLPEGHVRGIDFGVNHLKHASNKRGGPSRLRLWAITAAVAALLAFPLIARADNLIGDGDGITPVTPNDLVLGNVCAEATANGNVLLQINRVGSGNVYANGATVTVSRDSANATAYPELSVTMTDATIVLPSDWVDLANNTRSTDTALAQVTLTAPAATGPYSGVVKFNGTGDADPSGTLTRSADVTVTATVISCAPTNNPPTADAGGPYTGNEGAEIDLDGTGSTDSDGTIASYAWTVTPQSGGADDPDAGANCSFVAPTTSASAQPKVTCTDDGIFDVSLTVTDNGGATDTDATTLTLSNVPPVIGTVTPAAGHLVAVGTEVNVSAAFTDAGSNDTHTCTIDWDDDAGAVDGAVASLACSGSKTYSAAGVYTITIVVTDDDGDSDTETVNSMIIVYDPSAGFVTGGGWINSTAGAYRADTSLSGKATFGFVSKYLKGKNVPTGNTQFQLHFADLNFRSTSYEWLVVAGTSKAQYKGVGTINGEGNYGFLLTAYDGGNTGDKFPNQNLGHRHW